MSEQQTEIIRCEIPEKLGFLYEPHRYKVAYGGRGSAKSWSFARILIVRAARDPLRILCAREFQNSIQESVHKLLIDQIDSLSLTDEFEITQASIKSGAGAEFFFYGIRNNVTKVKSTEGIDIAWVEEAEKVSNNSWEVLIPTVRKSGSEIWITFNPHQETDPTYQRFIVNPPDDCVSIEINWDENPWFPDELRKEKDYLARVDPDAFTHIYSGKTKKFSAAQVLNGKWIIDSFEPQAGWNGPYFGADWGFANDPTTLVKLWIGAGRLYVEREVYGIGIEINDIPGRFDAIEDAKKYTIRGDNARPETMSYLRSHGYPKIFGAEKWTGSVEDGIAFLRQFEKIVIHSRCTHAQDEARLWSYKTDPLTGDVLPVLIEKHDHIWDAARYALEPMIKQGSTGMLDFLASQAAAEKAKKEEEAKKSFRIYG